jgi:hypothetical protein
MDRCRKGGREGGREVIPPRPQPFFGSHLIDLLQSCFDSLEANRPSVRPSVRPSLPSSLERCIPGAGEGQGGREGGGREGGRGGGRSQGGRESVQHTGRAP